MPKKMVTVVSAVPVRHRRVAGHGIAPLPAEGAGVRRHRRAGMGIAPVPASGAGVRRPRGSVGPRKVAHVAMGKGVAPVPPYGGVLTKKGVPRKRPVLSAAQVAHNEFVRMNVNKMPGKTPQQRMAEVNALYRKSK